MADFDEELRQDAEENAREAEYIMEQLPTELKEKFSTADLLYFMDHIVDYYFSSGALDAEPDSDGYVDIDMQKVAEYVCLKSKEEKHGDYDPADLLFVVQADMDFNMEEEE